MNLRTLRVRQRLDEHILVIRVLGDVMLSARCYRLVLSFDLPNRLSIVRGW